MANEFVARNGLVIKTVTTGTTESKILVQDDTGLVKVRSSSSFGELLNTGTIYYVKTGGSDSNTGLSDAQAWAHHPWMSTWTGTTILKSGDIVCMNRGDIWTISNPTAQYMRVGQNGTECNPITTTAYGSGAKPIINISTDSEYVVINGLGRSYITFDNLDISHWDEAKDLGSAGNYTGILGGYYGGDYSHNWIITNCDIHECPSYGIAISDGYNITIGDISVTQTATITSYSNHVYNCGYTGIWLGGCNPITYMSHYSIYYNYIHDIDIAGSVGDNAYAITFSTGEDSIDVTNYCYVRYNYISNVPTWHGIDCHNSKNIYVQDNYIKNCLRCIGLAPAHRDGASWSAVLDYAYVDGNTAEYTTEAAADNQTGITIQGEDPIYALHSYITNNTVFYTTRPTNTAGAGGIYTSTSDGLVIRGNKIYNGSTASSNGAIQLQGQVKNLTIDSNYINGWRPGISAVVSGIDGTYDIYNNIIINQGIGMSFESDNLEYDVNIYNNTILATSTSYYMSPVRVYLTDIDSGVTLTIKNNIIGFTTTQASTAYIIGPILITGTFECDYNLYWNCTNTEPLELYDSSRTWAYWTGATYDNNSPNYVHGDADLDPLFSNFSGNYSLDKDFILNANSPCVNAGTSGVTITTDYFGEDRIDIPDIGAIEKFSLTVKDGVITNVKDIWTGTNKIYNIVTLSQIEYDAIGTKDTTTLYIII